ncbi:MAG: M48 family metallopeptidase [Pseudomonadota bacterium]
MTRLLKFRFYRSLTLLTSLGLSTACVTTSPTGRTQLQLVSEQSAIASSKQAYTQMLAPLAEENKVDSKPNIKRRVDEIAKPIIEQAINMRPDTANWAWELKIIDDPKTVNAWAMAGGKMAVYTGLIEVIKPNDDELAQVLAHEISHALAKHSVEKMSVSAATALGVQAIGVAADLPPIAMQGGALLAAMAVSLPNSRTMESEADRIGIELAARAGFNPHAAVTLWEKMGAASQSRQPQLLSTHPHPQARQMALKTLIPQMMPLYEQAQGN